MTDKKMFLNCAKCGKRLIERKSNGLFRFMFGRNQENENGFVPVDMYIFGSLKMRCLNRDCRKKHPEFLNYFQFFPYENVEELNTINPTDNQIS